MLRFAPKPGTAPKGAFAAPTPNAADAAANGKAPEPDTNPAFGGVPKENNPADVLPADPANAPVPPAPQGANLGGAVLPPPNTPAAATKPATPATPAAPAAQAPAGGKP